MDEYNPEETQNSAEAGKFPIKNFCHSFPHDAEIEHKIYLSTDEVNKESSSPSCNQRGKEI